MESWQLQGAACCGITRGLHRDCSSDAHAVAFSLKISPSDFCVNEVSIKGVVADVSAAPSFDETEVAGASVRGKLSSEPPLLLEDDGLKPILSISSTDALASDASALPSAADILSLCFADSSEWALVHSRLSSIASTFFSNPKPHHLFLPHLLLLSNVAINDKVLRKRAYNIVRSMFPFVSLTTPIPPG
jgi:hypothetical protein